MADKTATLYMIMLKKVRISNKIGSISYDVMLPKAIP